MIATTNLEELIKKYGDPSLVPYGDLLKTTEWESKRKEIFNREKRTCNRCGILPEQWFTTDFKTNYYEISDSYTSSENGEPVNIFFSKCISSVKKNWLELHHNYYVLNEDFSWKLPWDYDDECWSCFCNWCHIKFHQENGKVPVFIQTESQGLIKFDELTPCLKCNGWGWIPQYEYYLNGICFRCNNDKYEQLIKQIKY